MVAMRQTQQQPMGRATIVALLLLTFMLISPLPSHAAVTPGITLTADSDTLYLGDTLVIELEAVGVLDTVDVSSLFRDADLLRETTGTRIAVIQDRVVEVKLRRMEFLPRRQGTIVFGPLQGDSIAGFVTSNTVSATVLPASNVQWQPDADDLQVSVTLSDANIENPDSESAYNAYIGQRIIADIQLRHRHPIADEHITLPDFDGFDVLAEYELRRTLELPERAPEAPAVVKEQQPSYSIGSTRSDTTDTDGVVENDTSSDEREGWRLISWRYHLFAQRSGSVSIGPVKWRGEAIKSRTQRAQFTQETDAMRVNIKPALASVNWWLPTSDISLSEAWSKDARELTAGDEILRTITLAASDVLASHLPDIVPLESRAISSTLIGQSRKQVLLGDHIKASATFTFRLVAQSPIPVFLDTVRVPWYDTTRSELREAIIPARRINVGLPDRADLLAELALGTRWQDKVELQIRAAASRFAYWYVSLIFLSLIAAILLVREILQSLKQRQADQTTSELPSL